MAGSALVYCLLTKVTSGRTVRKVTGGRGGGGEVPKKSVPGQIERKNSWTGVAQKKSSCNGNVNEKISCSSKIPHP